MAKRKSTFWSRLFGFKTEKAAKDKATTVKLGLESLEDRRVFATGLTTVFQNLGGSIEVHDASARDNNFTISRSGANIVITDNTNIFGNAFQVFGVNGATSIGTNRISIPLATIEATHKPLVVTTAEGNDVVKIDTRFDPIPSTGITLSTGIQSDRLELINDLNKNVWTLTGPQSGSVAIGTQGTVNFYGIESLKGGAGNDLFRLNYTGANPVGQLNGNGGNNAIQVTWDADFHLTDSSLKIVPVSPYQAVQNYQLANMGNASIVGGASNNWIDANYFTGSTILSGGDGNDTIWGGYGNDWADGGNGDDFVGGGPGDDVLYGSAGRDILVGGAGADQLDSSTNSSGDDILISGRTSYGYQKAFCDAVMSAWASNASYASRTYQLSSVGVGNTHQFLLNGSTMIDDGAYDALYGGSGQDWYFAGISGSVTDFYDAGSGEQAVDVNLHAPAAPSFYANNITSSQVTLNWNSVAGATGYAVQQYVDGLWTTMANLGSNATNFTTYGLNGGSTYTFRIGASNAAGTTYANSQSIMTLLEAPSVTEWSATTNEVDFTWNQVSGATGYQVQQYINNQWQVLANLNSWNCTFQVTQLASNATYDFRVIASNSVQSTPSDTLSVDTMPEEIIPPLPDDPNVNYWSDVNSITLYWDSVDGAESYNIEQYDPGTDSWSIVTTLDSDTTGFAFIGLFPGTTYDFRVSANNWAGSSSTEIFASTDIDWTLVDVEPLEE